MKIEEYKSSNNLDRYSGVVALDYDGYINNTSIDNVNMGDFLSHTTDVYRGNVEVINHYDISIDMTCCYNEIYNVNSEINNDSQYQHFIEDPAGGFACVTHENCITRKAYESIETINGIFFVDNDNDQTLFFNEDDAGEAFIHHESFSESGTYILQHNADADISLHLIDF